jgi:hypothetical protein
LSRLKTGDFSSFDCWVKNYRLQKTEGKPDELVAIPKVKKGEAPSLEHVKRPCTYEEIYDVLLRAYDEDNCTNIRLLYENVQKEYSKMHDHCFSDLGNALLRKWQNVIMMALRLLMKTLHEELFKKNQTINFE